MRAPLNLIILVLLLVSIDGIGQIIYRGIVVDSTTVSVLPGVHIKIKNSPKGTITDPNGHFSIVASPSDTLLFTRVGHKPFELPLLFEETALFVRLSEYVRLLNEITVQASRLQPSAIARTERVLPRPMKPAEGIFSPFDYFSRWQKEKRKLLKYIQENDRTITYLQVVSDVEIRETLMEQFSLSEDQYYELLAQFNKQSGQLQYSTDEETILSSLKSFLTKNTK